MTYIDPSIMKIKSSVVVQLKLICNELKAKGNIVYDLTLGQNPLPIPSVMVQEMQKYAGKNNYTPKGVPELLQAIMKYHQQQDKVEYKTENILIGPSLKILLEMLQHVLVSHVIVPAPSWVSYVPQAQLYGRRVSKILTSFEENWKLSAEKLEQCITQNCSQGECKLLILNTPGNPTGSVYSVYELQIIADVCKKYNVIVLSDEVYSQLNYQGEHHSIATHYQQGTIVASGISKWPSSAGWRLGYMAFPSELKWLKDALAKLASVQYTSVNTPTQYAAVKAFEFGYRIQDYLLHSRRVCKYVSNLACEILFEHGIKVSTPEAGFYLFLDFSVDRVKKRLISKGISNSVELCNRLLDECGVALVPGKAFGMPDGSLTARASLVNFDGEDALLLSREKGLEVGDLFLNIVLAMKVICSFIK